MFANKRLPNDDVQAARGTVPQEVRPGAGFKTGVFVERGRGGYRIVGRWACPYYCILYTPPHLSEEISIPAEQRLRRDQYSVHD